MFADMTHWEEIYQSKGVNDVSWFEGEPVTSLRLIDAWAGPPGPAVDVGAGRSNLAMRLLERGWHPVVALDLSAAALAHVAEGSPVGTELHCVVTDILDWQPDVQVALWHDRAVFHFLTNPQSRADYVSLATRTVRPAGTLVLGCFAIDGPAQCSGLDVCRYSASDLAALFSGGFTLCASEQQVHRTPWGATQAFTWVVLRRHG